MKTPKSLFISAAFMLAIYSADASRIETGRKAFDKGSFLISISEGSTTAIYSTGYSSSNGMIETRHSSKMDGCRDPLFIEYGIGRKWGIGLSSGADIFTLDPKTYYGISDNSTGNISAKTSEFTFDLNYHFYTSKRKDLSIYGSTGGFGVSFSGKTGEGNYTYTAKGNICRAGIRYRYYFFRRLGALVMLSTYNAKADTKTPLPGADRPVSTSIRGTALEFGLCLRLN